MCESRENEIKRNVVPVLEIRKIFMDSARLKQNLI